MSNEFAALLIGAGAFAGLLGYLLGFFVGYGRAIRHVAEGYHQGKRGGLDA